MSDDDAEVAAGRLRSRGTAVVAVLARVRDAELEGGALKVALVAADDDED